MLRAPLALTLALLSSCSLFVPAASEGEGDLGGEGEGEGDVVAGEGEGDVVTGEGEGDVVTGEGEGEGEGDIVTGEGEGDLGGEGEGEGDFGCADRSDEGFVDLVGIRACQGRWSVPGMHHTRDEPNTAESLCAAGWHVCLSSREVTTELAGAACTPDVPGTFLSRQSTTGGGRCDPGGNDIIGCSQSPPQRGPTECGAMNDIVNAGNCTGEGSVDFACDGGAASVHNEAVLVTHISDDGGVLCCRDQQAGACISYDDVGLGPEADTFVDQSNPSSSPGERSALLLNTNTFVLLRFNGGANFFDPNVEDASLQLTATAGTAGTADLHHFTNDWTERRNDCPGASSCDLIADGASFDGPHPQVDSNAQSPWPFGTFDLGAPAIDTAPLETGFWSATVGATVLRRASFIDDARAGVLSFVIRSDNATAAWSSREGPSSPSLTLHRCIDR